MVDSGLRSADCTALRSIKGKRESCDVCFRTSKICKICPMVDDRMVNSWKARRNSLAGKAQTPSSAFEMISCFETLMYSTFTIPTHTQQHVAHCPKTMAPIRRYLRITKYSVLEVRIYPEKPSDAPWLLSTRDPVLARVIEEVRPLVLPKLREENENARKKGGKKKKGIRDVASQEDFEVVMFLTEGLTRHSLITKQKSFGDKPKIRSTGNKLTGWLNGANDRENPITLEDEGEVPIGLREEAGDEPGLRDLSLADGANGASKRKADDEEEEADNEALFVSSDDEVTFQTQRAAPVKRRKGTRQQTKTRGSNNNEEAETGSGNEAAAADDDDEHDDDKKKLALKTTYDGFSIYGRILCLIVKRKGKKAAPGTVSGGSQMMEEWVSTQVAQEAGLMDDDEG